MLRKFVTPAFLAFLLLPSCKKDISTISELTNASVPVSESVKNGPIPAYIFDWETATYMPSSPANQIQMPWNSGTTAIDPGLANDYKKADGWRLVWNTFSPSTSITNPQTTLFFSLYNVYTGLLRFYLWQPPTAIATSYVTHGLSLYTNSINSPMLNFNAQEIIDPAIKQSTFSLISNRQINASGGTWYIFQYEVAYDPNITSTTFPNFGVKWASQYVSVSSINLNGSLQGSIKGALGTNSPASFNLGTLMKGVQAFYGGIEYAQNSDGEFSPNIKKALTNAGLGIVKNMLNAAFGLGGSSAQPINLTINANFTITGNMVSNGGLHDLKLVLPGQANVLTANGNTPAYTNLMGLFNVVNKPAVSLVSDIAPIDNINYNVWQSQYIFNPNSISFIWNPAIINSAPSGATIQNLQKQLFLIPKNNQKFYFGDLTYAGASELVFTSWDDLTKIEDIGNDQALVSPSLSSNQSLTIYRVGGSPSASIGRVGIRVSFDVVPNNGAKSYKVVHTFLPSGI